MNFDVIIVGGGMVGAATACALQEIFPKVALIDASPFEATEDHRFIALNYNSVSLFKNLNIWPALEAYASVIHDIHLSHKGHFGSIKLSALDVKLPFLGYVAPAKYINEALYKAFKKITLYRPAKLTEIHSMPDSVNLRIELPHGALELNSRLIIAADGTQSTVRKLSHIACSTTDYYQSALVTSTELHRSHFYRAYERFQTNGAIAMLPLQENRVATIWTAPTPYIQTLLQLNEADFIKQLQQHFGYRLGKMKNIGKRFSYPLQKVQAHQKIKDRIILLGNAAHTLHPIAAQGLNLALFEVATITELISKNIDQLTNLTDFAKQQENISMDLSHHLASFFAYDFFPLNKLKEIGLFAFELCYPLKKYFLQRILGRTKALPRLLREQFKYEQTSF